LADGQSSASIDNLDSCSVLPVTRWTNVSDDNQALTSLLHLFWTWDSTLSNIVDKGRFVADLCSDGPGLTVGGQKVFCSSLLVNAVLTVSALHSARKCYAFDPNAIALAHLFADEACQSLESERRVDSLTFLQGASILWFVTCNEKSLVTVKIHENLPKIVRKAWLALGFERGDFTVFNFSTMGTPSQMRDWHTISHISWGFYCFFMEVAESVSAKFLTSEPLVTKIVDNQSHWHDLGTLSPQTHILETPCQLEVFGLKYSLYQIMEQSMSAVSLDPVRCVAVYRLLRDWKLALPDHLDMGNSVASSVLSLHVSYESIALKVVTIYSKNSSTSHLDGWDARSLQLHHAKSMIILLWTYRCLYDTKFDRWAANQCFIVVRTLLPVYASDTTLFAIYDIISKACYILNEM
ncbi:c6 transcription factor, partial [Colletotrichum scovillei]